MASTITDLERLKVALGDQVPLLSNAPYDKIVTTDLVEEPQAVSFKIFLGYTRARRDSSAGNSSEHLEPSMTEIDREKVWVHLYPSQSSKGQPEIQFHAYSRDGSYIAKQDSETINKIISEFAVAFTLPGRRKWSRSKLVALAKYYFLRKMASTNETLQYGVVITKTFKDDLISACRNFAEEAERSNTNAEPATVLAREGESDESLLSEAPHGLLDEPDSSGSTTKKEEPAIQPKVEAAHARVMLTVSRIGKVAADIMYAILTKSELKF
jgi:hypothetical protein